MKTNILLFFTFLFGCCVLNIEEPLRVLNLSNHPLRVFWNDNKYYKSLYPDTVISDFDGEIPVSLIPPNEKSAITNGGYGSWKSVFEVSAPSDTISIFLLHPDTLSLYGWEKVRADYNVLIRYDLSLQDLERINFIITYPPDASMNGIKMYQP